MKCDYVGLTGCEIEAVGEVFYGGRLHSTRCQYCYDIMTHKELCEFKRFDASSRSIHAGDMATLEGGTLHELVSQLRPGDEVEAWYVLGSGCRGELYDMGGGDLRLGSGHYVVDGSTGKAHSALLELHVIRLAEPAKAEAPGVIVVSDYSCEVWKRHELGWLSRNGVVWDDGTAAEQWRGATVTALTAEQIKELFA